MAQVAAAEAVVRWYLGLHYGDADDPGLLATFCDPSRVGSFAADPQAAARGEPRALFKVLVAMAMFQRRQDVQIMRVLRGVSPADARELTDAARLRALADACPCPHTRSTEALRTRCDLSKHARTKRGTCGASPQVACRLKRHTELLKRYGHFGKVPTSLALAVREGGANDLAGLRRQVLSDHRAPPARALALEAALTRAWRVSEKISAMFLSAVTNPDLGPAPWADGVAWEYFVVIDSNVDLFLGSIGYAGMGTYAARREFLSALAARIDLSTLRAGLRPFNPRLVQQALYLFMSASNRRATAGDCMHLGRSACATCPAVLRERCPVRARAA